MRERIAWALWALFLFAIAAPASWGQVAAVSLTAAAPARGDTTDHLDVAVNRGPRRQSATIRARVLDGAGNVVSSYSPAWSTSDPTIATVVAGQVTARRAGVARVTLTTAGVSGSITVCVSDSGAAAQPVVQQWPAVTGSADPDTNAAQFPAHQPRHIMPAVAGLAPTQYFAIVAGDSLPGALDRARWPPECLHWTSRAPRLVSVDRRGVVRNVGGRDVVPLDYVRVSVGPP